MPKRSGETYIYRNGKREIFECEEPKRLSKFGEWMRAHPNGIGRIVNARAVAR